MSVPSEAVACGQSIAFRECCCFLIVTTAQLAPLLLVDLDQFCIPFVVLYFEACNHAHIFLIWSELRQARICIHAYISVETHKQKERWI